MANSQTNTKAKAGSLPRLVSGSREMLDKWAACSHDRRVINDFWEWLEGERTPEVMLRDIDLDRALEQFYGIDRRQLELERRALLNEQRAANNQEQRTGSDRREY